MLNKYAILSYVTLILMMPLSDAMASYPTEKHYCVKNKLYAGIRAGVDSLANSPTIIEPGFGLVVRQDEGHLGFAAGVIAGYGIELNKFYLGAEGFFDKTSPSLVSNVTVGSTTHYSTFIKNRWGVSLMPGYYVRETTKILGRVGYVNSTVHQYSSNNFNQSLDGLELGLSLEESFTDRLGLRGEYIYTQYRSFTKNRFAAIGEIDNFRLSSNEFLLSLIYNFL